MTFSDDSVYEGGWKNDKFHGQASLTLKTRHSMHESKLVQTAFSLPKPVVTFQGQFVEGVANGMATICFEVDEDGDGEQWERFEGRLKNG